ncbi:MAG: hypothetical protein ACK4FS_02850 [Flavobacterium sp.]
MQLPVKMKLLKLSTSIFSGVVFFFMYSLVLISCDFNSKTPKSEAVARVGNEFLYLEDVIDLVPEEASSEDSLSIVKSYIERWATRQLIIDAAIRNLSPEKQKEYDKLIQQYKLDLYTKGYLEEVVKQSLDTVVPLSELKQYYNLNKDNFRLSGALVRLRYIQLPEDHPKFDVIKNRFYEPKKNDKEFWDTYQLQFKSSALNDSVWVELNQIYRKLPFVTPDNRDQYIVSGKSSQYKDSTDVYLVRVLKVTDRNEIAPFEFIKPTLEEIILNQRKLELIKKFEQEIKNDAFKNKSYEVFP